MRRFTTTPTHLCKFEREIWLLQICSLREESDEAKIKTNGHDACERGRQDTVPGKVLVYTVRAMNTPYICKTMASRKVD